MEAVLELQALQAVDTDNANPSPDVAHCSHVSLLVGCHASTLSLLTCH
ncbi:SapB/AmfS family lanthipeptide [Amycolatopsis sp. YIM 10]|nr:hypothetical protein YIM_11665 [Amycolatopsis sp. YIM 10]